MFLASVLRISVAKTAEEDIKQANYKEANQVTTKPSTGPSFSVDEKTKSGIFCRKTFSSSSGEPLVLVMGYGASLKIWPISFIEKLAEEYVVITYDNRGTGLSIVPQDPEDYTIKKMSDDLDAVVQRFDVNRFYLLGYSMGGCIALQYAYDHRAKVRSLFLLSSTAGGALYVRPKPEISAALANPQGETLWDMYMWTFNLMYSPVALKRYEPALKAIYENSKDHPTTPIAIRGHEHAFKNFDGTSYLAGLSVPTTVLAGADDRLIPAQNSENLAKAIPHARLVLLDGCEHGAHVQEEAKVIHEIEKTFR